MSQTSPQSSLPRFLTAPISQGYGYTKGIERHSINVSSPSYKVKQLKVEISKSFTTHEFIELVDSLLWISPLLELLLIKYGKWIDEDKCYETISFKFSYEKPILGGENSSCCKFLPVPSWRHCLKSVTIENFRAFTNVETLKADEEFLEKYFYENAKFLESFQFIPRAVA
ncbi:uncharacterized protein LOC115987951 [Quercus lobata]|uniref:uncharacterized protein LOC115987951 n=1 Tax=Quercus lobata TaxID=97700 RepID=UPI0012478F97|nr:uncharacterized protein LOC115987951 [Quercus lobata]